MEISFTGLGGVIFPCSSPLQSSSSSTEHCSPQQSDSGLWESGRSEIILAWRMTACNRETKSLQPDYRIRNKHNALERETQWPTALICSWHIDNSFRKHKICNLLYAWNSIFNVGKHIAKSAWLEQCKLKAESEDANTTRQNKHSAYSFNAYLGRVKSCNILYFTNSIPTEASRRNWTAFSPQKKQFPGWILLHTRTPRALPSHPHHWIRNAETLKNWGVLHQN